MENKPETSCLRTANYYEGNGLSIQKRRLGAYRCLSRPTCKCFQTTSRGFNRLSRSQKVSYFYAQ